MATNNNTMRDCDSSIFAGLSPLVMLQSLPCTPASSATSSFSPPASPHYDMSDAMEIKQEQDAFKTPRRHPWKLVGQSVYHWQLEQARAMYFKRASNHVFQCARVLFPTPPKQLIASPFPTWVRAPPSFPSEIENEFSAAIAPAMPVPAQPSLASPPPPAIAPAIAPVLGSRACPVNLITP